jgi:hypothetical protein
MPGQRPPGRIGWKTVPSQIMGTKAERRAARERGQRLPPEAAGRAAQPRRSGVAAAIDRYRDGQIVACTADETTRHYHRAAAELWKFCFSRGAGSHAEFITGILDRMAAGAQTIDWREHATP